MSRALICFFRVAGPVAVVLAANALFARESTAAEPRAPLDLLGSAALEMDAGPSILARGPEAPDAAGGEAEARPSDGALEVDSPTVAEVDAGGEGTVPLAAVAPGPRYTRGRAVGLAAISATLALGSLGVNALPAFPIAGRTGYYFFATSLAASVPLAVVSTEDALVTSGFTLGGIGATLATSPIYAAWPRARPYSGAMGAFAAGFTTHEAFFAAYATYRDARAAGESSGWNDSWRPYTAGELIAAPLHIANLAHPVVYLPLGVMAGLEGVVLGVSYAKGGKLPDGAGPGLVFALPTALLAGVTEEALFRGFIYEELKLSLGKWPARAVDSTLFAFMHVPGEIGLQSRTQIELGLVVRAAGSLLCEMAYDQGGLPESVAFHTGWDVLVMVASALSPTSQSLGGFGGLALGRRGAAASRDPIIVPLYSGTF